MSDMEISRFPAKEEAAKNAGGFLDVLLRRHLDRPVLLLLSGGSSLGILRHVTNQALGKNQTIGMLDDRFSNDPAINNFLQIPEAFYKTAQERGAEFLDETVPLTGDTLVGVAERYEKTLKQWRSVNPNGVVIATVGIGKDGHIAGIMPHPEDPGRFLELFEQEGRWVVGYEAEGKNEIPLRITLTMPFLRQVTHATAFVVGEEKKRALELVCAQEGTLAGTPARILREMADVKLFTDIDIVV